MKTTMQITGDTELRATFRRLPERARDIAAEELETAGAETQRIARSFAPIRTTRLNRKSKPGQLRESIQYKVSRFHLYVDIFTRLFYAKFLEFGTKFMSAKPFLHPAGEIMRQKFAASLMTAWGRMVGN